MALNRLAEPAEQLVAPALVAAFDGWIDAAGASTAAAAHIAGDGETIATFEADALYDYRAAFRIPMPHAPDSELDRWDISPGRAAFPLVDGTMD